MCAQPAWLMSSWWSASWARTWALAIRHSQNMVASMDGVNTYLHCSCDGEARRVNSMASSHSVSSLVRKKMDYHGGTREGGRNAAEEVELLRKGQLDAILEQLVDDKEG
ncbi:hypothetical protein E2562_005053 [Oryza meyeriana var. granulata]|uniref:Uncharacterized protein n=1 Tax=Oryza meyeriana var. granulata TaxID=110450 RepID=A0A6G1BSU0_9ORYZ|nr:hypothetical protein E2562_005053 [Oryza meyeriana var. granulata]